MMLFLKDFIKRLSLQIQASIGFMFWIYWDQMKVSLLFDTKEHFELFGANIGPVLSEIGIDLVEPEVMDLNNIIRRNN